MTRSDLLDLVYRFYPRSILYGGLGYKDTEEFFRQLEAARRGAAQYPTWKAMLSRLRPRYTCTDRSLCTDLIYDPAYSGYISIPGHTVGFFVSWFGPCYGIRRTGAPDEEPVALDLAREIEATYPGYEPIPPELGDEVVLDVCTGGQSFGEATIYGCLLSPVWEWSSPPDDGVRSPDYVDPAAPDEPPDPGPADVESDLNIHYKDTRF